MRVKVYLHGHLRDRTGRDCIEMEVKSAYEALSHIANRFRTQLKAPLDIGRWRVRVKNYDTMDKLTGAIRHNVLHVYPTFFTGKSKWTQVVVGAVMVIAGAAMTYFGIPGGEYLVKAGIATMLSGVASILFAPKVSTNTEQKTNSKYLGAIGNTTAAGTRIPFGYGLYKVAGQFISYDVTSSKLKVIDRGI